MLTVEMVFELALSFSQEMPAVGESSRNPLSPRRLTG